MDAAIISRSVVVMASKCTELEARTLLERVCDPDIPFLSITDIAILRDVVVSQRGAVTVTVTPTYSGCPALEMIKDDIVSTLTEGGFDDVNVVVVYAPAWTTDWMSQTAKAKLAANRVAPPGPVGVVAEVLCPACSSSNVDTVSEFGSTACKSIMVCTSCLEPFDRFKPI